jgi:ubiquinone biosynthesis protein COQ9
MIGIGTRVSLGRRLPESGWISDVLAPIDWDLNFFTTTTMPPVRLATSLRATAVWRQRCHYHSSDYSQPPPFPRAESAILSAATSHIPSYGFTLDALRLGARDAGYLDASTNLLPRGVFDLINYHLVTQRLVLKDSVQFPLEAETGKKLGTGTKVRTLALARLRANEPVLHRWPEVVRPLGQSCGLLSL